MIFHNTKRCPGIFNLVIHVSWFFLKRSCEPKEMIKIFLIHITRHSTICKTYTGRYGYLRPYVRRKSDLPLSIGQIYAFYCDTTPYTLNDNVNTKSVRLNNLIDVCLQYCIETTWTMFQTVLYWEVNKDNSIQKSVVVELGFHLW